MKSALLGLVLDSSVLIASERRKLTAAQAIEDVQKTIGEVPVVLSSITVAEIGHGIYRSNMPEVRQRRRAFLDDLKAKAGQFVLVAHGAVSDVETVRRVMGTAGPAEVELHALQQPQPEAAISLR